MADYPFAGECEEKDIRFNGNIVSNPRTQLVCAIVKELAAFSPIQIRLAGSTALALESESIADSFQQLDARGSDIDIHVIANNYREWLGAIEWLGFPASALAEPSYDIFATKVTRDGIVISLHIYSQEVFETFCGLHLRRLRLFRTTPKNQIFVLVGFKGAIQDHWKAVAAQDGFILDVIHQPVQDGSFYLQPYPHMIVSGIKLAGASSTADCALALARSIKVQAIREHTTLDSEAWKRLLSYSERPIPVLLVSSLARINKIF